MKYILLSTFTLCIFVLNAQNEYTIKGKIQGINSGKVHLNISTSLYDNNHSETLIKNGEFYFNGKVKYPVEATIIAGNIAFSLFIENSIITINTNSKSANLRGEFLFEGISGSKSNNEYKNYLKQKSSSEKRIEKVSQLFEKAHYANDTLMKKKYMAEYNATSNFSKTYVTQNPNSYISAYVLNKDNHKFKKYELLTTLRSFDKRFYETHYLNQLFVKLNIGLDFFGKTHSEDELRNIFKETSNCIVKINLEQNFKIIENELLKCLKNSVNNNQDLLNKEYQKLKKVDKQLSWKLFLKHFEIQQFDFLEKNCSEYKQLIEKIESNNWWE